MKIFMISPVRNITPAFEADVAGEVARLEAQGHTVCWPLRDTYQGGDEESICAANLDAILQADEVRVCWDGTSEGCLFDLGMAYALHRPIRGVTGCVPRMTRGKSFANLIHAMGEQ